MFSIKESKSSMSNSRHFQESFVNRCNWVAPGAISPHSQCIKWAESCSTKCILPVWPHKKDIARIFILAVVFPRSYCIAGWRLYFSGTWELSRAYSIFLLRGCGAFRQAAGAVDAATAPIALKQRASNEDIASVLQLLFMEQGLSP